MRSSTDGHEHYAADESKASDAWAPWMDDRITTRYHAQYLDYFRSRTNSVPQLSPALQLELIELPDEPIELEQPAAVSGRHRPAARTGAQVAVRRLDLGEPVAQASRLAGVAPARKSAERTLSQGWHMAPASAALTAAMTPPVLEIAGEASAFESPERGVSFWVSSLAAGSGLFGAVLLGQVMLKASVSSPAMQRELPPVVAPVSAAPPVSESASAPLPTAASDSAVVSIPESPRPRAYADRARSAEPDAPARSARAERSRSARARHTSDDAAAAPSTRTRRSRDEHAEPSVRVAEPSASSGAPGNLRINSRPWSQVMLDGQVVGHTPLFDLRVAPGSHTLRLVNPEFGLSKTVQLKVAPGETVTRVELLEP